MEAGSSMLRVMAAEVRGVKVRRRERSAVGSKSHDGGFILGRAQRRLVDQVPTMRTQSHETEDAQL